MAPLPEAFVNPTWIEKLQNIASFSNPEISDFHMLAYIALFMCAVTFFLILGAGLRGDAVIE